MQGGTEAPPLLDRRNHVMRVLIATSSRHGSTSELDQWLSLSLADALHNCGVSATGEVLDAADIDSIAE